MSTLIGNKSKRTAGSTNRQSEIINRQFQNFMKNDEHKELLKKIRKIQIRTSHMVSDVFAGQYHSVFKGRGMEFDEVREYVPGDDVRTIDWNVTARTGIPHIKKFVEEREMTVMLLVDVSASHQFGCGEQLKRDLATEIAAVVAFSAIQNSDRVGLILFSDQIEKYIPPQKGSSHVLRIIREILHHEPQNKKTNVVPALDFLNHVCPRKATTFLISDFIFENDFIKPLRISAKRHDLIGMLIQDKHEFALPNVGIVEWHDAETGERFLVDTGDAKTRHALAAQQLEWREKMLEKLRRSNVDLVELSAGEPYERELIRFFKRRATRR